MKLRYGPTHRSVTQLYHSQDQVLAELTLPKSVEDTLKDYTLHPSLMDGALQASLALDDDLSSSLPKHLSLPFACQD